MPMTRGAWLAFRELQALGATVIEWGDSTKYGSDAAFLLVSENDDATEVFADITGKLIRERFEHGQFINPIGYRHDVHKILCKYELTTDWLNEGQVLVFTGHERPGYQHRNGSKGR